MMIELRIGADRMRRGFVVTLSTLGLIVLLVALSSSLQNSYLSMERALTEPRALLYAASLFDAVGSDINAIAGPGIDIIEGNNTMTIYLSDTVENENHSAKLEEYENMVEMTIANETHAAIALDLTNLTNGTTSMVINSRYNYQNSVPQKRMKFWASGNTNATAYELNFTALKERDGITHLSSDPSGNMEVRITSTDLNGTVVDTATISSETVSTYTLAFTDGSSVQVEFGKNDGTNAGALWITTDDVNATFSFIATVPKLNESEKLGYEYDATLDYSQGKISKSAKIGK